MGTDPITIIETRNIICLLKAAGRGAVCTYANASEAMQVCEKTRKFSEGKTLENGRPRKAALIKRVRSLCSRKNFGLMKHEGTKPLTEHEDELNHAERVSAIF